MAWGVSAPRSLSRRADEMEESSARQKWINREQGSASDGRNCRIICLNVSQIIPVFESLPLGVILQRVRGFRFRALCRRLGIVQKNNLLFAGAILIATALLISGCIRPSSEAPGVEIGRPAPGFKLPDLMGQEISLDQYRGKTVMLDFWATWCGPCRMTMPLLEKLQKEYANNLVLLAINLEETKDVVREYMRQQNLNSHVLLDEQGSLGKIYGTDAIPMQVLIDKEGIVRDIKTGFSPSMMSQLRAEIERLR